MSERHNIRSKVTHCQRCGDRTDYLTESWRPINGGEYYEEAGEPVPMELREKFMVCYQCDNEMMNGAPTNLEPDIIHNDREEQEYHYDPVNNPCPWRYQ